MTESNPCIFGPLLGPLHDGELSDQRRQEVLEHLQTCPHCPAELADIRRFGTVLSASAQASIPDHRLNEIFDRSVVLAAQSDSALSSLSRLSAGKPSEPTHLRYVRWASGVAAAIFLLAMGNLVYVNYIKETPADHRITPVPSVKPEIPATTPDAKPRNPA
ncbi:anti-sigma factor family protein [Humisphaera borealis]|uniref:Zf-HC2 domain-containing protein n=1 Tax=Humisphaera borealis TaxID=2807512 RepID=A0A7M2X2M4_9BACT|nr:zf-HC2 domain-containing protein [Humisphaera borealis]QOV91291.1 zf-HC2 domain-containing protein [Humisphaera borealis]